MIEAYKHGWPRLAVDAMIRSKLRGGFHQILAQGVDRLRLDLDRDSSGTLFLANHSCWWDLFLVHLLNETIPVDGYGMMEHFNLVRFGFFRRIGAFSVDRTDPTSVRASLDYASGRGRVSGSSLREKSRPTMPDRSSSSRASGP
jgi:1-acyl-sn-glycerol-3-phosphate acyltransferase